MRDHRHDLDLGGLKRDATKDSDVGMELQSGNFPARCTDRVPALQNKALMLAEENASEACAPAMLPRKVPEALRRGWPGFDQPFAPDPQPTEPTVERSQCRSLTLY